MTIEMTQLLKTGGGFRKQSSCHSQQLRCFKRDMGSGGQASANPMDRRAREPVAKRRQACDPST